MSAPCQTRVCWRFITGQSERLHVVLDEETQEYRPRSDALFTVWDAFVEAIITGAGPLGPLGMFGLWYGLLVSVFFSRGSRDEGTGTGKESMISAAKRIKMLLQSYHGSFA